jgi:tRNA pseudouridine55 synthase
MSATEHPIRIRVIRIDGSGECPLGLEVGRTFHSDQDVAQACHWAMHSLLPWTTALRFGGDVPWETKPGIAHVCCPDPNNPVVFEVQRVQACNCDTCPERLQPFRAPRRSEPLTGILNLDKPPALTSHDVVNMVRRIAGQKQVGHAGTLDPAATGVLLVCLGKATRVAEYLMAGRKRYRARITLGITTDTDDAEGQILSTSECPSLSQDDLEAYLTRFVGSIQQVPPTYSAIKKQGEAAYKKARRGEAVSLEPRLVEIDEIVLLDWTPPQLVAEVACGPGTYMRALARDLGEAIGCGAHLSSLVRLQSGRFRLQDAISLERAEEAFAHGEEAHLLSPPDEALLHVPALILSAEQARAVRHGQWIAAPAGKGVSRAYSPDGEFLAILDWDEERGQWHPKKVFA